MTHRWDFYLSDLIIMRENVDSNKILTGCYWHVPVFIIRTCQGGPAPWSICSVNWGSGPAASAAPEILSWVQCPGSDAQPWWRPLTTGPGRSSDTPKPAPQSDWHPWHNGQTPSLEDTVIMFSNTLKNNNEWIEMFNIRPYRPPRPNSNISYLFIACKQKGQNVFRTFLKQI